MEIRDNNYDYSKNKEQTIFEDYELNNLTQNKKKDQEEFSDRNLIRNQGKNKGNFYLFSNKLYGYQFKFPLGYHWISPVLSISFGFFIGIVSPFSIELLKDIKFLIPHIIIVISFLISTIITAFTDPGYVCMETYEGCKDEEELENNSNDDYYETDDDISSDLDEISCNKCFIPYSANAMHCDMCNICVQDYDHHCVVLGNCIGRKNLFWFKFMFFPIIIGLIYLYSLTFYSLLYHTEDNQIDKADDVSIDN